MDERDQGEDGLQAMLIAHRPALLRFLLARGAGESAEDLLQDLWIKLVDARPGPVDRPLSYLFRAAENLLRDRYRADRQAGLREQAWEETRGPAAAGVSDAPSGERVLIARETLAEVEAALDGLGDRAKKAFRLHRLEGMRQTEIAARLGVSLSTVESDIRKAYRAAADALRGVGGDDSVVGRRQGG